MVYTFLFCKCYLLHTEPNFSVKQMITLICGMPSEYCVHTIERHWTQDLTWNVSYLLIKSQFWALPCTEKVLIPQPRFQQIDAELSCRLTGILPREISVTMGKQICGCWVVGITSGGGRINMMEENFHNYLGPWTRLSHTRSCFFTTPWDLIQKNC